MRRLLISDLHLEDKRPDITRALFSLLDHFSDSIDELYILGDLFEIWLGDDALTETARQVSQRLKALSKEGISIFIMHGNRDFLIGKQYCDDCGATLIDEPHFIHLAGRKALLMHGDTLCIEDQLYMDFRRTVRNPGWQTAFLQKSIEERIAFGQQARNQSQEDAKDKSYEILDVTPSEVERVMNQYEVDLFIHGHTHRPARHNLKTQSGQSERIVLGDWHQKGWYLYGDDQKLELNSFEFGNDIA